MSDVLLIRLGYIEDVPNSVSSLTSLSEAFSVSALLGHFRNDRVTVVTSVRAAPLFRGARAVHRALAYDQIVSRGLAQERFDLVVNLEPGWEFCALADSVSASERRGFTLDEYGMDVVALPGSEELLVYLAGLSRRREMARPMQELLYEAVGAKWQGQEYELGIEPAVGEKYDVGFNVQTDAGWLNKDWSERRWRELEALCSQDYSISYFYEEYGQGIEEYVNWIAGCRVLVTQDTIGLHLALAMKKRIVGLFGPTSPGSIHLYGLGEALVPSVQLECRPCYELQCRFRRSCIESISPAEVCAAVSRQVEAAPLRGRSD